MDEELQREVDDYLARSREVLKRVREHQRYVDRTFDETMREIRRALAQLRRELRRAYY
jgi:hypothetical protein